jgi:hypothetical protein
MKAIATYAVVGALVAMAIGVRASAESQVALTVRLYNTSGIPAPELLAARRAVESTFRDTGLDLIVRHCGRPVSPEDPVDPCSESLKPKWSRHRRACVQLNPSSGNMARVSHQGDDRGLPPQRSTDFRAATRVGARPGRPVS